MLKISYKYHLLLKSIDEIIINTFDAADPIPAGKKLLEKIGKTFNCDRCYIRLFNDFEKKFLKIDKTSEYLKSSKIKSLSDYNFPSEFYEMINQFRKKSLMEHEDGIICLPNLNEQFLQSNGYKTDLIKIITEEFNIKSAYQSVIKNGSEILGLFVINYTEDFVNLTDEEIKVLEIVTLKIAYILKQTKLIEINKKRTEREILIRKVIRKISDTKDISEIKNYIVAKIGKELKASRCFIGEYEYVGENKNIFVKSEYISSSNIKSLKESAPVNKLAVDSFNKEIILYDTEKFLKENNFNDESRESNNLKDYDVKSGFSVPIYYNDKCLGSLIIHYDEAYGFKEEEIDFVRTIAEHIGIAINQCNLSISIKKGLEVEKLLRNLIATVRSTIELDEMITIICNEIGKTFNADRASIVQCNDEIGHANWSLIGEYTACKTVKTHKQANIDRGISMFWVDMLHKRGNKSYYIKNAQKEDLPEPLNSSYEKLGVKTMLGISIEKDNDKWGGLFLSKIKNYELWTEEEIKLLEVISDQIYTAIKQAKLYEITKKQVERENLLKKIIQEIRSSLDIKEIKNRIVRETGKLLGAERCFIYEFNPGTKQVYIDESSEYLSSSKAKSIAKQPITDIASEWSYINVIEKREVFIPDTKKYLEENNKFGSSIENYISTYNIRANVGMPILYGDTIQGNLVIHFNKENPISTEELNLIRAIADQAGIALYQAKLYEITKKQAERENLLRKITETLRSSLDIDETLQNIGKEIIKVFNVARSAIIEFPDKNDYKKWIVQGEFKINENIKGLNDIDYGVLTGEYNGSVVVGQGQTLVINNIQESSTPDYYKKTYEKMGVKSILSVPIKKEDDKWGLIFLSEHDYFREWKEDEILLLQTIADQIHIAITQSDLHSQTKKLAEKEALLRKITQTIRSSLDIDKTLKIICKEIAYLFDVEKVLIIEVPEDENKTQLIKSQYITDDSIKLHDFSQIDQFIHKYWKKITHEEGKLVIDNINESNLPEIFKKTYENLGTKSLLCISIKGENNDWGVINLHKVNGSRHWTASEIDLLKSISDQVYVAIKQAEMHETVKQKAERESLLRKSVETIRSTLDINETKKILVTEIGKAIDADRVLLVEFNQEKNTFSVLDKYSEYLASPELISCVGFDFSSPKVDFFANMHKQTKSIVIEDFENFIKENNLQNTLAAEWVSETELKTGISITILHGEKIYGVLSIHYTKGKVPISYEQVKFLETLGDQIGIAIHQAKLYKTVQEAAEREKLLRETIMSLLSSVSSLNINDVFKAIVTETGKLFNADRCFFVEYNPDKNEMLPTEEYKEYLSSQKIKPICDVIFKKEELSELVKIIIRQRQTLIVENTDKITFPEKTKKMLEKFSIKSFAGIPIIRGEGPSGVLVLHYIQDYKQFSQNEIDTLKIIASQSGIIINQAKLYKTVQETAKKEKLLAEIMAVIKSNLKLDEIFLIICSLLRQFYDVNKIFIAKLNTEEKKLNILNEGHQDNDSHDCKLSSKSKSYLYEEIAKNKNIIINDVKTSDKPEYLVKDLISDNIISFMMVPITINANEIGTIIIRDNKKNNWREEDFNFLLKVADYIAIVIKDSNLYNQAEFVSNVSHELKTPLSIINGYANAVLNSEKLDYKTTSKFLNIIKNNSERLNKLIDNLLFISTIEKKVQSENMVFEKLKVSDLIENSIQFCDEKVKLKDMKVEKNIENIVIKKANVILLQQLLINLIINAINYSEPSSIIKINAVKKDKEILISVEDKGCGIKKEHISNIFQRFYRVDKSRNRETGGTGLGLNIAKLISEMHGGYITVDSVFNEGSTFTLHLPE